MGVRQASGPFKSEKNKEANSPIFLYTIYDYDGLGTDLRFCGWSSDVTYDGQVYTAIPVRHEAVGSNSAGEIDSVKLVLGNADRSLQSYLENYDFRGKKVSIKLVWADLLDDNTAFIEDIFYINSYVADEEKVVVNLKSKLDVLDVMIPCRIYVRDYCQWEFKSPECGYSGSETSCSKRLSRCRELGNVSRFGGFPSVPSKRIYIT